MQEVMVVVPVNAEVNEGENIGRENGPHRFKRLQADLMRNLQLEHHHRDDDRDDTVAECFEPAFAHALQTMVARRTGIQSEITQGAGTRNTRSTQTALTAALFAGATNISRDTDGSNSPINQER